MKVPRQCPLVLLLKIALGHGKALDSEEGSVMGEYYKEAENYG